MTVKPRQSVKLTDPQTAFLNKEAQRLGITVAELIRRIIDEHRSPVWARLERLRGEILPNQDPPP